MRMTTKDNLASRLARKARKSVSLAALGLTVAFAGLAMPAAHADNVQTGSKEVSNNTGQKFNIIAFTDGLRRDKYAVWDYTTNRPTWYSMTGSVNGGKGESGRHTSKQEWCRVRYLYGDDVRIPECWGSFMYSSHLITGINNHHYELWFSPSSLSYYKIRDQDTGIWYAHDGSANDGKVHTTKADWCRIIIYHGSGIIKSPKECDDIKASIVKASAGLGPKSNFVTEFTALQGMFDAADVNNLGGSANFMLATYSAGSTVDDLIRGGKDGFVGAAVGYGTEKVKEKLGLKAQNADAGQITAEILTTTAVNTSLSTMILAASGSTLNPVTIGIGAVTAAAVAGGQELAKASADTGIELEPTYGSHPRYNRDLNYIADHNVKPRELPGFTNPSTFLKSKVSGKCIDVQGSPGTLNGARLQIWDCETSVYNTDQRFVLTKEGFLKSHIGGRCVDVEGSPGMNNGAKLQLWDCETTNNNTDQKWQFTSAGQLKNLKSGRCVDVQGSPGRNNGTFLQLWDCEDPKSNTDQTWTSFKP